MSRARGLWSFVPRFDEPIEPEIYRVSGRIRVMSLLVLISINGMSLLDTDVLGYDRDFYLLWTLFNTPLLLADLVIGFVMWKRPLGVTALYRLTITCVLLECGSTLLGIWGWGSVGSQMVVFGFALVLIYRAALGFEAGAVAFLTLLLGHWAIVFAEVGGWIDPQRIYAGPPSQVYASPNAHLGSMLVQTFSLVTVFIVANWLVARLRHKEQTIRLLRESLAVQEGGKVGRHTGRTLNDTYVVGSLIGVGGMGEIYRGYHRRTRRALALKLIHPHLIGDATLLARFRREAEITGRLGNEHIVEIVDVDQDDDTPFMALELLDGESLAARIARAPLALDEVADVIAQLADGLAVAHAAGVVHRDLKPENIFLCRRSDGVLVKILDFGISKIRADATAITQDATLLGTPDFMSPEQARGEIDALDARTDLFAVAGITYELLTGRRPFAASSVPALLRRICDEEPASPRKLRPDLPAEVEPVLALGLAKRASEREADVRAFAEALAVALRGEADPQLAARAAKLHRGAPATLSAETAISGTAATIDDHSPAGVS